MATGGLDPQLELVTCSLCYEVYNHVGRLAKGLPCMHTFCLKCLKKCVKKKVDVQWPCPLCKTKFTVPQDGVNAIPTNILAMQLLDNLSVKATPDYTFPKGKVMSDGICSVHNRKGSMHMCKSCDVPLCWECMKTIPKGPHATHTLDEIQDSVAAIEKECNELKEKIANFPMQLESYHENMSNEYSASMNEAIADVDAKAEKVIAEAVEWKNNTVKEINAHFDENTRVLRQKQDDQDSLRDSLHERMKQVEECLERCDIEDGRKHMDALVRGLEEFKNAIPNADEFTFCHISDTFTLDLGDFHISESTMGVNAPVAQAISPSRNIICHQLGSDYNFCAGLEGSAALLADRTKQTLVKFIVDATDVKRVLEKALPDGMDESCRKYLLDDGRIVLRAWGNKDPTHMYTANLTTKRTFSGDYDVLIGTLTPDFLVYAKKISAKHGYEVRIYSADNHQRVLTLRPGEGRKWSTWCMSVCRHTQTGYMAVVNMVPSMLDIYDKNGIHQHHADLTRTPCTINAMCCSSQYIFTIQHHPAILSIHNWAATLLCDVDRAQLQLTDDDYLRAVGSVSEDTIMLAVGSSINSNINSLHSYKVT